MNKKSILTMLLVVILLGALPLSSLAAPGDILLFDREWIKENIADGMNMRDAVVTNDKIYGLFNTRVYEYQLNAEEPTLLVDFLPGKEKEYYYFNTYQEAQEKLGEEAYTYIEQLFTWKEQLYGLNMLTGQAFLLDTTKGEMVKENPIALDWDIEIIAQALEEQNSVDRTICGPVGDELFMLAHLYIDGPTMQQVYSFNLTTGQRKEYKSEHIQRLLPYKEDQLLAVVQDEANSYDHEAEKPVYPKVMVFDSTQDSLLPYADLPQGDLAGFAYGQNEDALFYNTKGRVYKIKPQEKEEQVGYVSNANTYYRDEAWMADHSLYVTTSYDGVSVKNIDAQYMNVKPLTISGTMLADNMLAFQKTHPDVPVVMAEEMEGEDYSTQSLSQAIQTGDGSVDIFSVFPGSANFKILMEKEYAYPLSGSSLIKANTERMYPFIQEGITLNGEIYAVPLYMDLTTTVSYSPEMFEKVGLTQADVPTTYIEYLELFKRWNEELAEKNPDYSFMSYQFPIEQLTNEVLSQYADLYAKKGELLDFDTPLFRTLMAKVAEGFENVEMSPAAEEEEYKQGLFADYGDNALMVAEGYYPIMVPLDKEVEGAAEARVELAFINPKSSNIEMAIAYLESIMNNYRKEKEIAYYTDVKEPLPFENFEEWVKDWEESLAEDKVKLETAQGVEKKDLEQGIAHGEKLLANKEEHRWEISAQAITNYENMVSSFYIPKESLLYSQDEDNNIYRLLENYTQGAITLDQFIVEANRRVQMMAIENQ